ncbi:putative DNA modification/repair radical SAM protein [Pseudoleptotrichia goodfellowii]|uniref:Putative DNA modification/repair radical SAM protein n=1 Tax=Pseudoleptotrichia goodfellowii F0264 TaxID=596323 RepID=D0GIE1_9FUSO|nr:putative DNA modification/repair radical SAM protein [Pseudoleptotrichia goodfellowii]EEY36132.1 putative DNA modification/repair radical SAM protein [Pseudoleptotrichia goodfellowii F0264]
MNKPVEDKLRILSAAAKYDVSCSSSGSKRANKNNGLGNAAFSGICHSWSADGRCVSLLKILMTNHCMYDCKYCVNRRSNDIERAILTPEEIVKLTVNFYRRNYIEGLFLSSGIIKSADYTMEQMIIVAKKLRLEENFNGYIHMKVIPGTSKELIREMGLYVDRVSVNIELAESKALKLLAPDKKSIDISTSMGLVHKNEVENKEEKKIFKSAPLYIPAGQTTQMIIGASGESDYKILNKSENLYKNFDLKRVYYSAYVPVNKSGILANVDAAPMIREHRLYQADWLLRFYKFKAGEILNEQNPFFDPLLDPKANWALRNWYLFPMEINRASYKELLRIPGIGINSARRIVMSRKYGIIKYEHLQKLGVVIKRAKYFITVNGEFLGLKKENPELIRNILIEREKIGMYQMRLF